MHYSHLSATFYFRFMLSEEITMWIFHTAVGAPYMLVQSAHFMAFSCHRFTSNWDKSWGRIFPSCTDKPWLMPTVSFILYLPVITMAYSWPTKSEHESLMLTIVLPHYLPYFSFDIYHQPSYFAIRPLEEWKWCLSSSTPLPVPHREAIYKYVALNRCGSIKTAVLIITPV